MTIKNIGTDYTIQRKCVNEDSVVDLFKKNGFVEVFAEDLSMSEKVSTFANADVVAGPIGGGMANLLFSNKDTKVISINSPEFFPTNERLKNAMLHTDIIFTMIRSLSIEWTIKSHIKMLFLYLED